MQSLKVVHPFPLPKLSSVVHQCEKPNTRVGHLQSQQLKMDFVPARRPRAKVANVCPHSMQLSEGLTVRNCREKRQGRSLIFLQMSLGALRALGSTFACLGLHANCCSGSMYCLHGDGWWSALLFRMQIGKEECWS